MENVTVYGASGRAYIFESYDYSSQFNEVKCAYIYTRKESNKFYLLYIGITDHLKTRIEEHKYDGKEECAKKYGLNCLLVWIPSGVLAAVPLKNIEDDLLARNKTPCNIKQP